MVYFQWPYLVHGSYAISVGCTVNRRKLERPTEVVDFPVVLCFFRYNEKENPGLNLQRGSGPRFYNTLKIDGLC